MFFAPIDKMWDRAQNERQDSERSLFDALLGMGELVVKTTVAGMVAAVDDRSPEQYRLIYNLIRSDGLGDWSTALEDVLTGPAKQHVTTDAQEEVRELTQRHGDGSWQYSAVVSMHQVLKLVYPPCEPLTTRVSGKQWVSLFVQVRNKTRGHGALLSSTVAQACGPLELSIREFIDHFSLFRRPWVYLHRTVSGKYRVTPISAEIGAFDLLKKRYAIDEKIKLPDGVYLHYGRPVETKLMSSDVDGLDFFFPNGGATGKRYEVLSYISGTTRHDDISPFILPPGDLPESETHGIRTLREEGRCFDNIPPMQRGYVRRRQLEAKLREVLCDDRNPIVTLVGRGGIGKTSLALKVLSEIARGTRFDLVLWFSARDIDLRPEGPKRVKPDVLSVEDAARSLIRLLEPLGLPSVPSPVGFFAQALNHGPFEGTSTLFVFDNFETVHAPQDLYNRIYTHIRLPNKVLITTRTRDFNGDYWVEVPGMTEPEADSLIDGTVNLLNISATLTSEYRQQLYRESDGHPYVIKVLLGEVKKTGHALKVERIVAGQDDLLDALFQRTYQDLSPVAQRLFLTLSSWRSVVPQLAVEAVLLRPQNERMDVERAIDELQQSSMIDMSVSEDRSVFLMVPLVASVFGRRKLAVSPWRSAIEADRELLQAIGVAQPQETQQGIGPRIHRMFRTFAQKSASSPDAMQTYLPIMQFIARKYAPAWLYLSDVLEDEGSESSRRQAREAVTRYLEVAEFPEDRRTGWTRLAELCRRSGDIDGEAHTLMELCLIPSLAYEDLSIAMHRLNSLSQYGYRFETEEKQLLARQAAKVMEARISEATATDCSRLAWHYRHLHDGEKARQYTELGLYLDPENQYCNRLAQQLAVPAKEARHGFPSF